MSQLRILVVMPSIPLQGMERANIKIMKHMKAKGACVLFIAEKYFGDEVVAVLDSEKLESVRIPYGPILGLSYNPFLIFSRLVAWKKISSQIQKVARDFKPTHIYFTNLTFFLYGLPFLKKANSKVVFRLPNPPNNSVRGKRQLVNKWVWKKLVVPNCDYLICNSEHTRRELERITGGGVDPILIRNMLARKSFKGISDSPRLESNHFHVVYTGRISEAKGVGLLLEAASEIVKIFPDIEFHLAGEKDWKNDFALAWEKRLKHECLTNRIHLYGTVSDIYGLLDQADIHVCPSISQNESFPNVVLEAKSRGVPSVVFAIAGLPEAINHLVDGYICSDTSIEALTEGIIYFHRSKKHTSQAASYAKKSLSKFDDATIGEQWQALFLADKPRNKMQRKRAS